MLYLSTIGPVRTTSYGSNTITLKATKNSNKIKNLFSIYYIFMYSAFIPAKRPISNF